MTRLPAILGGKPVCPSAVPFARPVVPPFEAIEAELRTMFRDGVFTKGRRLAEFERAVAAHLGVRHAVAVSSCTAGLMLTYRGLDLEGDVVVPSFTFMATVSALVWAGLRPVFADVDPETATADPDSVERAITPGTSAIVAVHTFGNPADIDGLRDVAGRHGLKLVFDAAHGFGSLCGGRPLGPQGDAQVFSMSPTKLLVAAEGGVVATDDDALADRVRAGREYGNDGLYDTVIAGINARLAEFNAILGLRSLEMLEQVAVSRNDQAALYAEALAGLPGIAFQRVRDGDRSSYKDLTIRVDACRFEMTRDALAAGLAAEGIDTRRYYSPPVHRQTAYRRFANPGTELRSTDRLASECLSLPIGGHVGPGLINSIASAIRRLHESADQVTEHFERTAAAPARFGAALTTA